MSIDTETTPTKQSPEDEFREELKHLINKYSKENSSGTPDFILANYMSGALKLYEDTIHEREGWHGRPINTCAGGSID